MNSREVLRQITELLEALAEQDLLFWVNLCKEIGRVWMACGIREQRSIQTEVTAEDAAVHVALATEQTAQINGETEALEVSSGS
ncbi:unnamed protein product [Lasius platythorax]|uniref:Uncharacterized protein n=1 Tax=Lasius platythorax TaxID=488582 RepID=A0AAV2MY78_9HYME